MITSCYSVVRNVQYRSYGGREVSNYTVSIYDLRIVLDAPVWVRRCVAVQSNQRYSARAAMNRFRKWYYTAAAQYPKFVVTGDTFGLTLAQAKSLSGLTHPMAAMDAVVEYLQEHNLYGVGDKS